MDVIKQLLGRLHPLIVHLPIGFIIAGLLLQFLDRKKKESTQVISTLYLWGGYFAVIACITGYLQYLGEGYAFDSIKIHLWSGIATTLFTFILWARLKAFSFVFFLTRIPVLVLSGLIFILLSFTGHQGGNITHGEEYLVEPLPNSIKSALGYEIFEAKEITLKDETWESAILYSDIIEPILNNNCVSCHNPKKAKGDLLLHTEEGILTSGENSPIILANHPDKSDLFIRMELPKTDDKHMPPDGKKQPSKEEIKLVGIWIEKGLPFNKTIGELKLPKSLFQSFFPRSETTDYPAIDIPLPSLDSIKNIKNMGIHIEPISEKTNFLKVSALNMPSFKNADFGPLNSIAPQIAILDLGGTQITDGIFNDLTKLPNLTVLKLDNTMITGKSIENLKILKHLKTINLSNSDFKEANLPLLKGFENLERIFLFMPNVNKTGVETINEGSTIIEYGNYSLPIIKSDSIVY
ncbi:c-type cytochrome domain-containing protein [Zobellia roscoffensis]|uniref:c-type cytochrome domain-containing protein n=1 Tax=Zobellia roscoffensis TaxID=2779508 RepID=UPI00188B8DB9|nr:c-type cytochrome domain-containing protein [Zobellia roscoffensis]